MSRTWFRALLLAGLAFRLWTLPAWGTFDTEVQKAWSARAARDGMGDIYGPSDRDLLAWARAEGGSVSHLLHAEWPRTRFTWGEAVSFVDYPPESVIELWAAGKAYQLVDPTLANRWPFNVAINVLPLLCSIAIAWVLYRTAPG